MYEGGGEKGWREERGEGGRELFSMYFKFPTRRDGMEVAVV